MDFESLRKNWEEFGRTDPLWSILTWESKQSGRWDPEEFFATGRRDVEAILAKVQSLGLRPQGRALDFGCGVGRLTQDLACGFAETHGVDIARSMIALAQKINAYPEKCFYHLNPRPDLRLFPDSHFDFILSWLTLQHMAPRYAAGYLREFLRVLKAGGVLVFQLPAAPPGMRGLKGWLQSVAPDGCFRAWRRLKSRLQRRPVMEMHGMEKAKVVALIESGGGRVVSTDVARNEYSESWAYYAVRNV